MKKHHINEAFWYFVLSIISVFVVGFALEEDGITGISVWTLLAPIPVIFLLFFVAGQIGKDHSDLNK